MEWKRGKGEWQEIGMGRGKGRIIAPWLLGRDVPDCRKRDKYPAAHYIPIKLPLNIILKPMYQTALWL